MTNEINSSNVKELIDTAKEIINIIPEESRKELLTPIAKTAGQTGSSLLNVLGYPINWLSLVASDSLERKRMALEHSTQKKMENLKKQGHYTEENVGMAVKALEDSRFSLNSDVLRAFFSELIANSFDSTKAEQLSPMFSTILSNMTEKDARFLSQIKHSDDPHGVAITTISFYDENNHRYPLVSDLIFWEENVFDNFDGTLNVLESFGVIKIERNRWWTTGKYPSIYQSIENSSIYLEKELLVGKLPHAKKIGHSDGYIEITPFGKSFLDVVVV